MTKFERDEPITNHVADASTTATSPGTGADGTTWTGAQCTAAYNDLVSLATKVNSILATLENAGLHRTA